MPNVLPIGDPVPSTGELPASALRELGQHPFGVYVHIPFCAARCGYCDFNTYTPSELNDDRTVADFQAAVHQELALAAEVMGGVQPPASTIFFGGGTPTLLPSQALGQVLSRIRAEFGLREQAEISCEANPDSVTAASLAQLAAAGFTRVSFGMQSAVPQVLATLERTHRPQAVARAVSWAKQAGLAVSLDLIYGAPGETLAQWRQSLTAALDLEPDHISAYALIIEAGTALAARVRRGQLHPASGDELADKYELADQLITAAGLTWYEVSNWSRTAADQCQHNLGYWTGGQWWGIGPGAHSHIGGVRWWNVKHPRAYADRLSARVSPAHGREILTPAQRQVERVMLGLRLRAGLDLAQIPAAGRAQVAALIADGLLDGRSALAQRAVLTDRGRLLADAAVRTLLPDA